VVAARDRPRPRRRGKTGRPLCPYGMITGPPSLETCAERIEHARPCAQLGGRPSRRRARVIGLSIWAQIGYQRQGSFVTGCPGRPPVSITSHNPPIGNTTPVAPCPNGT